MSGRLSRWYAAAGIVGLLYLTSWVFAAGFGGSVIQVQWGAYPELEGAEVAIDGEVAGTLFRRGRRTLSGFKVKLGEHRVSIVHPDLPSDTAVVVAEVRGVQYMLFAYEESEGYGPDRVHRIGLGPRFPD